jgi:hypothetical protein
MAESEATKVIARATTMASRPDAETDCFLVPDTPLPEYGR